MERLNGQLLSEYRQKNGKTYGGIAAELGISPSTVRQMEEGYLPRKGRVEILARLATLLGVSVAALTLAPEAKHRTA